MSPQCNQYVEISRYFIYVVTNDTNQMTNNTRSLGNHTMAASNELSEVC